MSQSRNPLALVIGAAVATGALAGPLFSMDAMAHGYLQDPPKAAASEGTSHSDPTYDGEVTKSAVTGSVRRSRSPAGMPMGSRNSGSRSG